MKESQLQGKQSDFENRYPLLRLGYADVYLLGSWDGVSNVLYSLRKDHHFWVQFDSDSNRDFVETYTVLDGSLEIEYEGQTRQLQLGETIDAAEFENTIRFNAMTDAEILIEMTASVFEPGFFETQILQEEAEAIEALDGYTYMHCNRIKDYSIEVWTHLGLPKDQLKNLRWGAYFHDIGKRVIPLHILNKPGQLTPEEWEIMKTHTTEGAKILRNHSVEWLRQADYIVEQHHERYDGKGYPKGLMGDEISIEAAIVAVVDAFDAMTTDRIYKKAMPIHEAVQELIKGKGTQFNPKIVDTFLEVLGQKKFQWK